LPHSVELSVTASFGTLITKTIRHRQVFLFSHLTYFVQLLYLGKLSYNYQQKFNMIVKILHEDAILLKIYLSKGCTKAVE